MEYYYPTYQIPSKIQLKGTPSCVVTTFAFICAFFLELNLVMQTMLYGFNIFSTITGPNLLFGILNFTHITAEFICVILLISVTWLSEYLPTLQTCKIILLISGIYAAVFSIAAIIVLCIIKPTDDPMKDDIRMVIYEIIMNLLIFIPAFILIYYYVIQIAANTMKIYHEYKVVTNMGIYGNIPNHGFKYVIPI